MAWVEAEEVAALDQHELALAVGPPGQVSLVGSHLFRQRKGPGGRLSLLLLILFGAALCNHRSLRLGDSVPFGIGQPVHRVHKSVLNRF